MKIKPLHIFLSLCLAFLMYSLSIYLRPLSIPKSQDFNAQQAAKGKLVWQKYNCQSCHQLYGLGGYLGPDLTNIISEKGKDEIYIKALVQSGAKQMPAFQLNEDEFNDLLEFFRAANASGIADPRSFETNTYLMIEQKSKK